MFFIATRIEDIVAAVSEAKKLKEPLFILGGGTNLLIPDAGFKGVMLKPAITSLERIEGSRIRVGAGVLVSTLNYFTVRQGLTGLEWSGGLPGTVGGAVYGNAGAFGGEIKDSVVEVLSLDIAGAEPKLIRRTNPECQFSYRNSIFKSRTLEGTDQAAPGYAPPKEIILEVIFQLAPGLSTDINAGVHEKIDYRIARQPLDYPNIGSTFKNIPVTNVPEAVLKQYEHKIKQDPFPVLPTAVLISEAGLKGTKSGGAMISDKHPNFIVNLGGAKSEDVRALAQTIKDTLHQRYGVDLEREVIFL